MRSLSLTLVLIAASVAVACGSPTPAAVGTVAPDFTLSAENGQPVSLKDYRGKWVVLFFYPAENRGVLVARNFQRDVAQYRSLNAVILGVSAQSPETHRQFVEQEGLRYALLTDTGARAATHYGSTLGLFARIHETMSVSSAPDRNTFLIDSEGKIARVFGHFDARYHSAEVLSALKALQSQAH